jgi:ribosomal protein S19E (S16A)
MARKLPELAKAVSLRYRQHAAMQKTERIHYLRTVVRITVEDLHETGVFPGKRIVERVLPKGMSLRDRAAEEERVETMRRLGLL